MVPRALLAPCAVGGVITADVARRLRARAICGAANNILADGEVAHALREREVLFVPDVVASAGAVIEGIGRTVMGMADRTPLIDALASTARRILQDSLRSGQTTERVASKVAAERVGPTAKKAGS